MTPESAKAMAATRWWVNLPSREVAEFQLGERLLCMDFPDFHQAVERALGRGVFSHEFAEPDKLLAELRGLSGVRESQPVSSRNPLAGTTETAMEHLKNGQMIARGLQELLEGKGLTALAGDVKAVYDRIERAREECMKGNIGR